MTHRDKAKSILKHYFRQAVGAYWSADNDAEIDYFVDEMILAVGEASQERTIEDWKSFFDDSEYAEKLGKPIGILVHPIGEPESWINGSRVPESPVFFVHEYPSFRYFVTHIGWGDNNKKFYGVWLR